MKLHIKRVSDGAEYQFNWLIFKSPQVSIDPVTHTQQQTDVEGAAPFYVSTESGKNVNILFVNTEKRKHVRDHLSKFRTEYDNFYQQRSVQQALQQSIAQGKDVSALALASYYADQNPKNTQNVNALIQREFDWKAGRYDATLLIYTSAPKKKYEYRFNYEITVQEEETLRDNFEKIILETCGVQPMQYNFIWPEYRNFQG